MSFKELLSVFSRVSNVSSPHWDKASKRETLHNWFTYLFATWVLLLPSLAVSAPNVVSWGDSTFVPDDLTNAVAVAAGAGFSLALKPDGTVVEWTTSNAPVVFPPLSNVVSISADGAYRMAIMADRTIKWWGSPCQCNGAPYNNLDFPWLFPPLPTNIVQLRSPACDFGLALTAGGSLTGIRFCTLPPDVGWYMNPPGGPGGSNYVSFSASYCYVSALRNDGRVEVGGRNTGRCPVSSSSPNVEPLAPPDLSNVVAIASSGFNLVALKSDGTLAGGFHVEGQPWNGGSYDVPITGSNIATIAYGSDGIIGVRSNGTLVAIVGTIPIPANLPYATDVAVGYGRYLALVQPQVPVYPPTIMRHPTSQTVPVGSEVVLTATALGMPPMSYQWFFNKTNLIEGATYPNLKLSNVQPSNSGAYTMKVSNPVGSVTSNPAMLSVAPTLEIKWLPGVLLTGGIGTTYRLEWINRVGSVDTWSNLATVTITNTPQYYFDLSGIGQPQRNYRLVQMP